MFQAERTYDGRVAFVSQDDWLVQLVNEQKETIDKLARAIEETTAACRVFTTPIEHRGYWDEFKTDAEDRLRTLRQLLADLQIEVPHEA